MTTLTVTGVHKSFGAEAVLRGVDLVVPPGSLTAILGPSGSGKTTLLRIAAGFERADAGTVAIGDEVVDDPDHYVPPDRRHLGYVPQEGSLFPHLTVEKNITFGLPRRQRRSAAVTELIEMVGLAGLGRRYPHQLSGGQQQRVALARALAIGPRLVLLDEPFSSLDAGLRASVRADVLAVLRAAGTTALLVTHDQDEALSAADLVAVIGEGRIRQLDTPERLYAAPEGPETARFVGDANLVVGRFAAGSVTTALGSLVLTEPPPAGAEGRPATVLVRPEQLELARVPAEGALPAEVVEFEYYGHDAVIRVRPEGALPVLVARTAGGDVWAPGTRIGISARGPVVAWARPDPPPADPGTGTTRT
ncbi:MAG TPA: ABC transporter ATP-binding protein [Acidimicrobiales bacterium]|nr:ABC transporter ATP-binding protein [Acidimicrobiales bacterium]